MQNQTLKQLHAERLARRGIEIIEPAKAEEMMGMGAEDRDAPAPEIVAEVEEVEVESCPVCLMEMETKHRLECGHVICGECPAHMKTQNLGNGCVAEHTEAGIKVIRCPVCRVQDMPTREELIAEIVRIRRGGHFSRLHAPRVLVDPRVEERQRLERMDEAGRVAEQAHLRAQERRRLWDMEEQRMAQAQAHNLPAIIPVLQPVPAPQPVVDPARHAEVMERLAQQPRGNAQVQVQVAPVALVAHDRAVNVPVPANTFLDGNWLRRLNLQPQGEVWHRRVIHNTMGNYLVHNIFRGNNQLYADAWDAGDRIAGRGVVLGEGNLRRFYANDYCIPVNTEGRAVPTRRVCSGCVGAHERRTARRCARGCGEFICQTSKIANNLTANYII